MYLTAEQVRKLDGPTIEAFLRRKYPEGHHLDYKAQLSHPDQKAHREFLKDISAFANANGGHLLIGVREPSDDLDLGAQVVGIDRPLDVAQKLENLASSSIDPRIAGLQIIPVTVCGKGIVFIHVPPSSTRPHRVDHQGHSAFYRRHTESIFAMTTYEIRESVLSTLGAEYRAREYCLTQRKETEQYILPEGPFLLVQCAPLIGLDAEWDVLADPFIEIFRDSKRKRRQFSWPLDSPVAPRPTMHGILGTDDRQSPRWIVEVHRAGFTSVAQPLSQSYKVPGAYLFDATTCHLFRNFGALCDEIWSHFQTDVPCLLRSVAIRAKHVALLTGSGFTERLTDQWGRPVFELPDAIRQPGESLDSIADAWCSAVHNAFGTKAPPELLERGGR